MGKKLHKYIKKKEKIVFLFLYSNSYEAIKTKAKAFALWSF